MVYLRPDLDARPAGLRLESGVSLARPPEQLLAGLGAVVARRVHPHPLRPGQLGGAHGHGDLIRVEAPAPRADGHRGQAVGLGRLARGRGRLLQVVAVQVPVALAVPEGAGVVECPFDAREADLRHQFGGFADLAVRRHQRVHAQLHPAPPARRCVAEPGL